jgi:hypothetical protein
MRYPRLTKHRASILTGLIGVAVLLRLTGCADPSALTGPRERGASLTAAASASVVLVGAADIASCATNLGDEQTAALINPILGSDPTAQVFAAGDVVYEDGTATEFTNCYDPSWGQFKARTRPAIGNHEYNVSPTPYFNYFGASAGQPGKGYYSYDLGQWHIVVLNSNSQHVPTSAGSAQDTWLKADLAATAKPCTLAFWHHARFRSSATSPLDPPFAPVKPFWDALYAAKADVVLVGHQHFYERFAPQTPDGQLDNQNGIRQFLVGTGGKSTGPQPTVIAPNSQVRNGGKQEFGVLKLTLGDGTYSWQFIPVAGKTFTDAGTGTCHPKSGGGGAGAVAVNGGNNQSAAVGSAVATRPSVKVTDASNQPLADVAVTFAVASGGGSITGAAQQTTDAGGIATVGSWTLGTAAGSGNNTLTATSAGLTGSPVTFTASATPGPANATHSTATVPNGTVGSLTPISVRAKDQYGNILTIGGETVVVTVSGANSGTPAVTDNADGTYSASYTPGTAGSDQVAITLNGGAISGSPYSSTVSGGGGGATTIAANAGNGQTATVHAAVATPPSVKVTDGGGNPVAGVAVGFAVTAGGGSITGPSPTTDPSGIATVASWTLGTAAGSGNNTLTATSAGLTGSPVTFTASATPGPADAASSTATVPSGTVGSPTTIGVQAKDQYGNSLTTGGAAVVVTVSGANSASPAVTDNANGTYTASYTPTTAGSDQVAITLGGTAISGSPYTSSVTGGGATMSIAVNAGDNQTATAGTAVAIRPAVKVTDATGNPVAGVNIKWAVGSGGGSATGVSGTTSLGGIDKVGSWTLGSAPGPNTLTATATGAGIANNPVTFTATGN